MVQIPHQKGPPPQSAPLQDFIEPQSEGHRPIMDPMQEQARFCNSPGPRSQNIRPLTERRRGRCCLVLHETLPYASLTTLLSNYPRVTSDSDPAKMLPMYLGGRSQDPLALGFEGADAHSSSYLSLSLPSPSRAAIVTTTPTPISRLPSCCSIDGSKKQLIQPRGPTRQTNRTSPVGGARAEVRYGPDHFVWSLVETSPGLRALLDVGTATARQK